MSVNDKILDKSIGHQIDLQFYSNGVANKMMAIINKADADLSSQIQSAIERLPRDSFTVRRLEALLGSLRSLNSGTYTQVSNELDKELKDLVEYEADFQKQLFENTIPVKVSVASVDVEQIYAAAMATPMQGKLLKEWTDGLEVDKAVRIRDAIRMGYVENQTISQIVQRVRGTKALNYKDGVLEISKSHAQTVVRTAISHTSAFTRDRFLEANSEVIKAVQWSSTLDGRTSDICKARDGKQYTADTHKPIGHSLPWLGGAGRAHFNCRSAVVGVTKSWKEMGFDIDELPPSTRSSMDGQVPDDLTYSAWLKGKDAPFQDKVLGKVKARAFRNGLPLEKFTNRAGVSYTIAQLKELNPKYFTNAVKDVVPKVKVKSVATKLSAIDYSNLKTMPSSIEGFSIEKRSVAGARFLAVGGSNGILLNTNRKAMAAWKDIAAYQQKAFDSGWQSSPHPNHIVWHELGHAKFKTLASIDKDSAMKNLNKNSNPTFHKVALKVSRYAATNGHEFIAEVFAGLRAGIKFDDEVMRFYNFMTEGILNG